MSAEAKVGAFAMGGIGMLTAAAVGLGGINFGSDNNMTLYADFKQVVGLENQADVRLSGVLVGKVDDIALGRNDSGVIVTLKIDPDVKIPKGSIAGIASVGVMGNKFVNITPKADEGEYLSNGDEIPGVEEADMNQMFEGIDKVLGSVDELLKAFQKIVGNETFQTSVVEMSDHIKDASGHLNGLMESMERISKDNETAIGQMTRQMNAVLENMNATMANVEHMTANLDKFAGDPQTVEDLRSTLSNISATTKNIANMADNMNKVAGDPKVAEDMKETISNARNLTERADKILGKVQGTAEKVSSIEMTPSVDMLYSGDESDWDANFNVNLATEDTSLNLGIEDIGDGSKFNAQIGKQFDDFGARAGVVAGKVGLGFDAYAGDKWKFSAEGYDPNDFNLRLKSQFKVDDSTYILGEWHNVNHKDDRAAYFGIKQEF